jgi:sialate O-acetylesterase
MKTKAFFIFSVLLFSGLLSAKVQLPHILADNMVLQQKADVKLWGKACPNTQIVIKASWGSKKFKTQSDQNGKWLLTLPTPEAGGPYEISINDGENLVLKNILLGEVWICSGQSNMEMPMKGFPGMPVEGGNDVIAKSKLSVPIRMFTTKNEFSETLQDDIAGTWLENTPEAVSNCSATAYYFAKYIQEVLGVPVGVIVSAWGGTKIEAWISEGVLRSIPGNESYSMRPGFNAPNNLYNAKIYPLSNYAIKGFLWYQGESNEHNPDMYEKLFPAFVKDIRRTWGQGDFPFYYVQIAPFKGPCTKIREVQLKSLNVIPNAGMAVTMDIGEENNIHPAKKEQVGNRLAYWALSKTYGIKGIACRAPEYKSMEIRENKIALSFDYFSSTCVSPLATDLANFEIAGEDKVFHLAKANVGQISHQIVVYSDEVPHPIAVRYGYKNYVNGNVYDDFGLPISSFRTDNW